MTASRDKDDKTASPKSDDRANRLAAELRANLARRKAQARSRRSGKVDERPDGLQPGVKERDA